FFLSRDRARDGFLVFIATLGLGFRTVAITPVLRIHPAEIALFLTLLLSVGVPSATRPHASRTLPIWLWVLLPFLGVGWLTGMDNTRSWDEQLSECSNIALAISVFLVTRAVL